jgi:cytoskeleton protein RodZ
METLPPPIKLEPLKPGRRKRGARRGWRRQEGPRALRDIRERAGISLESIAENTRIPLHHLEEIERGDVSNLPPGIYAKSWARAYADAIGVDAGTVLAAVAPVAAVEPTIDEIKQVREERERMRVDESPLAPLVLLMRKFAAVAVVLVLLVLAVLFFLRGGDDKADLAPAPAGTSGVMPAQPPR